MARPKKKDVAVHPLAKPEPEAVIKGSISRISSYSSCNTAGWLKYVKKAKGTFEPDFFWTGSVVHEAIENYYKGFVDTVLEGAHMALKDRFDELGLAHELKRVLAAAELESSLLAKFAAGGEITKPDGSLYTSPKMTKAWKDMAEDSGLNFFNKKLRSIKLGTLKLPPGGVAEVVGRVIYLAKRYQETLLIPREQFEEIHIEDGFNIDEPIPGTGLTFRFNGYIDLHGKLKDGTWVLFDYKTGKAHEEEVHSAGSHSSLQLTLYWWYLTKHKGIDPASLKIALHYVDAGFEAETTRVDTDMAILMEMAKHYVTVKDQPGIPKRFFYDGDDCKRCLLRDACLGEFGHPTTASEKHTKELSDAKSAKRLDR